MQYVKARLEQEKRELAYRYYVADSLRLVPQNKCKVHRLIEIYHPEMIQEEKTGDEIAADVIQNAGLRFR